MSSTPAVAHDLIAAYRAVCSRIHLVSSSFHRPPPRLVAVSKTKPAELIHSLYKETSQRHFGENYVKELIDKSHQLPEDIQWHFIGHLQSNKIKTLLKNVPNLFLIESIDSIKLARELQRLLVLEEQEKKQVRKMNIYIQINTSGEMSKSGCSPGEAKELFSYILSQCPNLCCLGLMTIGRLTDDHSPQVDCFQLLSDCKKSLEADFPNLPDPLELSMGMSGDFQEAIEYGATNIRIGSTIFGSRDYSKEMKEDYSKEDSKEKK